MGVGFDLLLWMGVEVGSGLEWGGVGSYQASGITFQKNHFGRLFRNVYSRRLFKVFFKNFSGAFKFHLRLFVIIMLQIWLRIKDESENSNFFFVLGVFCCRKT